jgi:hypothetical protein
MAVFLLGVLADELKEVAGAKITTGNKAPQNVAIQPPDSPLTRPIWRLLASKKLQVFIEKQYTKKSD